MYYLNEEMSSTNSIYSIGGGPVPPSIAVPDVFRCPIGANIMRDPVTDPTDGKTYDRVNIEQWLAQHSTSPQTRQHLTIAMLVPNRALKDMIDAALASGMTDSSGGTAVSFFASAASAAARAGGIAEPVAAPVIPPVTLEITRVPGTNLYHVVLSAADMGRDNTLPLATECVLDISGSMGSSSVDESRYGEEAAAAFSRSDLVQHAMRVTVEGSISHQSIGMTLFDHVAVDALPIMQMSVDSKFRARDAIRMIVPNGGTYIYGGLEMGLKKLEVTAHTDRTAGIKRNYVMVLQTDGQTQNEPPAEGGSAGALSTWMRTHPDISLTVHTLGYGFGDSLDTALLQRISTAGKGMCLYISDGNMVVTTVCHLMANCMSALYTNVRIRIPETGTVVELGDLRGGKTRSTVIEISTPNFTVEVTSDTGTTIATKVIDAATVPVATVEAEVTYIRLGLIQAIRDALTMARSSDFASATHVIDAWYARASGSTATAHPTVKAMLTDVKHTDTTKGQVRLAVTSAPNFQRWGQHFLPQALCQYTYEWATNFKDDYSADCRTGTMKVIYDDLVRTGLGLPPPVASRAAQASASARAASQAAYTPAAIARAMATGSSAMYNAGGGCWAPGTLVLMTDGVTRKLIEDIRRGDVVWTPTGPAVVEHAIEMNRYAPMQLMCKYQNKLLITPWHPVMENNVWYQPADFQNPVDMPMRTVYNMVLSKGHIVNVNSILSCTLGHGFTGDVIGHNFFGTKECILIALSTLPGFDIGRPIFTNLVAIKDAFTGQITAWVDDIDDYSDMPALILC